MKTISIKQPWAQLIVEGIKDIENRTWPTKFRGRVLIHASMDKHLMNIVPTSFLTEDQIDLIKNVRFSPKEWDLYGVIIGSVEIVDCVVNHPSCWAEKSEITIGVMQMGVKPIYNWVLANPIKFPEPIPAKGKLSFWNYPNISAEPEEEGGRLYCHCQLSVDERAQVSNFGGGYLVCRYCHGIWYK